MESTPSKRKFLTETEAVRRAENWCARQERSHHQVRRKLFDWGQGEDASERIIAGLIGNGFLNEQRFAQAYAGGKFRMKKWGRRRIEARLRHEGLSPRCIATGLREIDDQSYRATLDKLLRQKLAALTGLDPFVRKHRAARFAIGKGYEPELVWQLLGGED